MWWECSACGGPIERERPPVRCRECGIAGAVFVPIDDGDLPVAEAGANSLREAWIRAGLDLAREGVLA